AKQQQLTAFVQDLQTTSTNVQSANSTVVDVNMAQEMSSFTTDQILLQSGLSMLGQAQANPTLVLKLL
ncbi:MAG TPA: flagellin, partial [Acidimicrobiales bacterium]|nr:flagellin [Acidimicrobiales bacterium]